MNVAIVVAAGRGLADGVNVVAARARVEARPGRVREAGLLRYVLLNRGKTLMKEGLLEMSSHAAEVAGGERFEFGENWSRFLSTLDPSTPILKVSHLDKRFGSLVVRQQRLRACCDPGSPVCRAHAGHLRETHAGVCGTFGTS